MNAVVTKYHAVRNRLLDKLESMGPGAQLPSERDLSREFGVSRMTIRRATEELVATGVVQRKKGAGVFAAGQSPGGWWALRGPSVPYSPLSMAA